MNAELECQGCMLWQAHVLLDVETKLLQCLGVEQRRFKETHRKLEQQ